MKHLFLILALVALFTSCSKEDKVLQTGVEYHPTKSTKGEKGEKKEQPQRDNDL